MICRRVTVPEMIEGSSSLSELEEKLKEVGMQFGSPRNLARFLCESWVQSSKGGLEVIT